MIVLTKSEQRALVIIATILFISILFQWFHPHTVNSKIYDYSMQDSLFKILSSDTALTDNMESEKQTKPLKSTKNKSQKKEKLKEKSININTANEKELTKLPRIGPATAKLIIEYRNKNGNFKSVDELEKVKRIGPKTIEKICPYIYVDTDSSKSGEK